MGNGLLKFMSYLTLHSCQNHLFSLKIHPRHAEHCVEFSVSTGCRFEFGDCNVLSDPTNLEWSEVIPDSLYCHLFF